jgi:hypothetical protein
MRTCGGGGGIAMLLLYLGDVSCLTESALKTHFIRGWIGLTAYLDANSFASTVNLTPVPQPHKGKVKLSLCLTKHYAMKTYEAMHVNIYAFLTSALVGGEWSATRPGLFAPRERAPCCNLIGGCLDPRASLDNIKK